MPKLSDLEDPEILEAEAEKFAALCENSGIPIEGGWQDDFNRVMKEGCGRILAKSDDQLAKEIAAFCAIDYE